MNVPVFIDISLEDQAEELRRFFKSQVCHDLLNYLMTMRESESFYVLIGVALCGSLVYCAFCILITAIMSWK